MEKQHLLIALSDNEEVARSMKDFLRSLRNEELLVGIYQHDPAGFLETAAEYLETNFAEMQSKLRMS